MVHLDPDVARAFPDSEAVNDALRALVKIIDRRSDAD
jgi:Arc/MetJ family transcription regulator